MSLTKCFDAAFPPAVAPAGCGAVLGYIGDPGPGRLDRAEHVWTLEEWQRFAGLRQFPCWVADFTKDPVESAERAIALAVDLGWSIHRAIVYDTEALVDKDWCQRFERTLQAFLFAPVNYGSASVVAQNGSFTVWLAKWDGDAQLEDGQDVYAHQYQPGVQVPGGIVDLSVMVVTLFHRGGTGSRWLR